METDIKNLVEILNSIAKLLAWIVRESGLIKEEFRPLLLNSLGDMEERINSARNKLNAVKSPADPIYEKLKDCGLTGSSLAMKRAVGRSLYQEVADSAVHTPEGPRILGFKLKFPLKWINSILGSLAKVFPPLEAVKEYKEHVDLMVEEKQSEPAWGYKPIFDLG
jgi:hypothetical protein